LDNLLEEMEIAIEAKNKGKVDANSHLNV